VIVHIPSSSLVEFNLFLWNSTQMYVLTFRQTIISTSLVLLLVSCFGSGESAELPEVEAAKLCCQSFSYEQKFAGFHNTNRSSKLFTSSSSLTTIEMDNFTIDWRRKGKRLKGICTKAKTTITIRLLL